jgi:L-galactose dehydrogenase/L-glyceraldehyde 3-phosphate reductase
MELRQLGRTGVEVSVIGFGCGTVGGLMVRGSPRDQDRAVKRAIELGVNYFDTAAAYGDGASEQNLGRALKSAGSDVLVGTKLKIAPAERRLIADSVASALEASLKRLGRDSVDLVQLHDPISDAAGGKGLDWETVLQEVTPAFERLCRHGKARFCGITALGDTAAIHKVIEWRRFDTVQVVYNLLNPSASGPVPPGFPAQDYAGLLARAQDGAMGALAIRVLAGGALGAEGSRHPLAKSAVDPMGSGSSFAADVRRARRLEALVREGYVDSLAEAAVRFAVSCRAVSSVIVGFSSVEQLEAAAGAAGKGPLEAAALARLSELQRKFIGEPR